MNADVEAAYPGNAYVDIIGLDAYDTSTVSAANPSARWNDQLNRPYGLLWQRSFAAAHGKPMSFPEWGLADRYIDNLGGGDNPDYIARMVDWIGANNFMYSSYFEVDAGDAVPSADDQPVPPASAEYRAWSTRGRRRPRR